MSDKETDKGRRREYWNAAKRAIAGWTDGKGKGVEAGIIETVVACNVLGIGTSMSCEGHVNWGMPAPWIRIDAADKPSERFVNERIVFGEVAARHGLAVRDLFKRKNEVLHREAIALASANGEIEEYVEWRNRGWGMKLRAKALLEEFYRDRVVEKEIALVMDGGGGIINAGAASLWIRRTRCGMDAEEQQLAEQRLNEYRAEMQDFTEFLKIIYFTK